MVTVSIVTAWKDLGDPHRRRGLAHVVSYWQRLLPDAEFVIGSPEPFTRAAGLNEAIRSAAGDIILHTDPDSFVLSNQIREALELASAADGLVVPFTGYRYLDRASTAHVYDWAEAGNLEPLLLFDDAEAKLSCDDFGAGGVGNVTAFSRSTWEQAGGYDERFGMWGGDDAAFAYACHHLVAPYRRVEGPVFHLWHPRLPESIPGHPGYVASMTILEKYRDAPDADAIREILRQR